MISNSYKKQLREIHASKKWGNSGHTWSDRITAYANALEAETIIDYGCGTGTLRMAIGHDYHVHNYDPGVKGWDVFPSKPADMLVCTDVLEHVEPEYLDDTLSAIDGLYTKGAFLVIACNAAKEILPDGRNAHLIQEPPKWWASKFNNVDHFIDEKKRALIWLRKT